ncbi:hypothetical protein [Lactiplantibacillus brownii]|uniref:hypothetical protein n=1 Tax=Lactiplantibacillus brownii TaxID=3069269 RepID=UPI0038B309E9
MNGTLNKKISNWIAAGFKVAHLNLVRSYQAFIAILGIIPIAYLLYILMNANQKSQTVVVALTASPYATVMLIVALLDVVCAYTLWNFRQVMLQHRRVFKCTMILLTVAQLLLGNVILFVVGLACLFFSNQVPDQKFAKFSQVKVMLYLTSVAYLFCLVIIIRLIIH